MRLLTKSLQMTTSPDFAPKISSYAFLPIGHANDRQPETGFRGAREIPLVVELCDRRVTWVATLHFEIADPRRYCSMQLKYAQPQ